MNRDFQNIETEWYKMNLRKELHFSYSPLAFHCQASLIKRMHANCEAWRTTFRHPTLQDETFLQLLWIVHLHRSRRYPAINRQKCHHHLLFCVLPVKLTLSDNLPHIHEYSIPSRMLSRENSDAHVRSVHRSIYVKQNTKRGVNVCIWAGAELRRAHVLVKQRSNNQCSDVGNPWVIRW